MIDAALRCLSRSGLDRTSISSVAAEAGISRPTVYTHFRSREELISAALDHAASVVTERIIARASRANSAAQYVVELMVAAHREFLADPSASLIPRVSVDPQWPLAGELSPQLLARGRHFLAPLLGFDPSLARRLDEITETAIRFFLSLLMYRSERSSTDRRLRAYLYRSVVPALGLQAP
jgi:AcrR family transcriptional regulator